MVLSGALVIAIVPGMRLTNDSMVMPLTVSSR